MDLTYIERALYKVNTPPGERIINSDKLQEFDNLSIHRGIFAKKIINNTLLYKNYNQIKNMQSELLNHYENDVDWFQRDDSFDFELYKR